MSTNVEDEMTYLKRLIDRSVGSINGIWNGHQGGAPFLPRRRLFIIQLRLSAKGTQITYVTALQLKAIKMGQE